MEGSSIKDVAGEYSGWLLKEAPKVDDVDKESSTARKLRRVANAFLGLLAKRSTFKRRFFVLDGHELRYYRGDDCAVQSGLVDLSTVMDVRYSDDPRHPAFSFQLVSVMQRCAMSVVPSHRIFASAG